MTRHSKPGDAWSLASSCTFRVFVWLDSIPLYGVQVSGSWLFGSQYQKPAHQIHPWLVAT